MSNTIEKLYDLYKDLSVQKDEAYIAYLKDLDKHRSDKMNISDKVKVIKNDDEKT